MRILEEIKNQVERKMKLISGKCIEKRYAKITKKLKQEFIMKVVQEGKTIKQSSKELCINYSSAKAIMADYRKAQQSLFDCQTSSSTPRTQQLSSPMVELSSNCIGYDWGKFKVQTKCDQITISEFTLEEYMKNVI